MAASAEEALGKVIGELYSQPGVSGSCVQAGRKVLRHDLPFSDERVGTFASQVDHMVSSYEGVGRNVWQVCAGFGTYWLLILCRGSIRLSLLLNPDADTSLIATRAAHLLMQIDPPSMPEPEPKVSDPKPVASTASTNGHHPAIPRAALEDLLGNLLGRVTGSSQASKLIARQMKTAKVESLEAINFIDAKKIGLAVLEFVPNRGKRSALISEFLNAIEE